MLATSCRDSSREHCGVSAPSTVATSFYGPFDSRNKYEQQESTAPWNKTSNNTPRAVYCEPGFSRHDGT